MSKFKVGDKAFANIDMARKGSRGLYCVPADRYGIEITIIEVASTKGNTVQGYRAKENGYYYPEYALEPIGPTREFIVLRRDGQQVIASHKRGDEIVKTAKAICSPSDTFDFATGAKIAFDRMMGREEPKPEPQPAPDTKYFNHSKNFELRSKFKIDDRVTRDGKTGKVVGHERDSHDWVWVLFDGDSRPFPNLEHFLSPAPAPKAEPKLYTGKVRLVKSCGCYECDHIIGKVFEISEGKLTGFVGAWGQPFSSFSDFVSKRHNKNWIEVKD